MDRTEENVKSYFVHCGYKNIRYEPDGNVSPDFLVDGKIAIEVRRLNQYFNNNEEKQELETVSCSLQKEIEKIILSFNNNKQEISWYITYNFARPIRYKQQTKLLKQLRKKLEIFINNSIRTAMDINLPEQNPILNVNLQRSGRSCSKFFLLGGFLDEDEGGWIDYELEKNFIHCVEDKTKKLAKYKFKYPIWWLMLEDYVGHARKNIGLENIQQFLETWDKIILLDPTDSSRALEVWSK